MKKIVALSLAGIALSVSFPGHASTLVVDSTSVVYSDAPKVTASLHLTSPSKNYSGVYVTPQYLDGTLDGELVHLFAYCVDILNYAGPGTFDVVSLSDYLGGNTSKYNQIAALIAASGGPTGKLTDAVTQAAIWEAMYDNNPFNLSSGNFRMDKVKNHPTLIADANAALTNAVSNAGASGSNLQLFVAKNNRRQDMLFWTMSAVPEPSTWAMLLLGFGLVGGTMRAKRRKQNVSVSYA